MARPTLTRPRSSTLPSGRAGAPWSPPTRRAFLTALGALGAAAGALALEHRGAVRTLDDDDRPRSPWTGTTRWIGHC